MIDENEVKSRVFSQKERAESDFQAAFELKDPVLIASAMDRLNKIDKEILRLDWIDKAKNEKNGFDEPKISLDQAILDAKQDEWIRWFEKKTGKKLDVRGAIE